MRGRSENPMPRSLLVLLLVLAASAGCATPQQTDSAEGTDGTAPPAGGVPTPTPAAPSATPTSAATPGPAATPTPAASRPGGTGADVKLLTKSERRDSIGYFHVVGEVENLGPQNAEFVKVTGTFYDAADAVVATTSTFTGRGVVPAGQKSPYDLMVEDKDAKIARYKLTVSASPTSKSPAGEGLLEARGVTTNTDAIGYHHVVGEVQNNADRRATFVKVVATFYDAAGTVVGTAFTFTDPSEVPAGGSAPFDLFVDADDVPPIARHALYVEAQALR